MSRLHSESLLSISSIGLATFTILQLRRDIQKANARVLGLKSIDTLTVSQLSTRSWRPVIGGFALGILSSNWAGALLPIGLLQINGIEVKAPTGDINTTTALALSVSALYFYGGLQTRGIAYFTRYVSPVAYLLPINLLEDCAKPLSLSFRLFGNILADELTIAVLTGLVPFLIPIPVMLLGTFTSAIQALVFATLAAAYTYESTEV